MKISRIILIGIWIAAFIVLFISQLAHWSKYGSLQWYDVVISFAICSILCLFGHEISSAIASIWKPSE